MIKLFSFGFDSKNSQTKLIAAINQVESELRTISDLEIKQKSIQLQNLSQKVSTLNSDTLIQGFALVREASLRTLGLRHYDTQLFGGLVLNDNKIAEMKTGEGKTLVATAPAFVNALTKKGVHIVTVNEYLAQRDAEWMGQIYRFLGLKVGLVKSQMEFFQKRKNYNRDITYITNSELAFDFLRDNLVSQVTDLVQRPFNYCIIDEVDSILIDEARTPLIISGQTKVEINKIIKAREVSKFLSEVKDYDINKKSKTISLTNLGIRKVQKLLKVKNIYNSVEPWIPFILNAIKAKVLFLKNIHYIVKNNQIVIVDEFTGRILDGRRWSDGLHNAIEAKENIYNMAGNETIASITYQNFFRLYPKIAGMTGTAKTEELEFENIYNLSVAVLPTFKPIKRIDLPDNIYMDEISKWKAVAKECQELYKLQQPVLVGTTSIQNSEILSILLNEFKIPHQLLNAKPENIKRESEIISQAGCLKSVTIATNMAGRGTDILLGGNPEFKAYKNTIAILNAIIFNRSIPLIKQYPELSELIKSVAVNKRILISLKEDIETLLNIINIPNKILNSFELVILILYKKVFNICQKECKIEKDKVLTIGGLYVIGTERHESRRIDNQLRGRAGRQGDPGTSRFFLSLNDPLLKIFGGERIKKLMQVLKMNDEVLESKLLSNSLDSAQQKVEGFYYDQRRILNKYDRVLDKQRAILYHFRNKILISSNIKDIILEFGESILDELVINTKPEHNSFKIPQHVKYLIETLNLGLYNEVKFVNLGDLKKFLLEQLWCFYFLRELDFWFYDIQLFRKYEKLIALKYIDLYWSKHLDNMNFLKDSITWEAYAQKDPFIQYEEQASSLFTTTLNQCKNAIFYTLINIETL
jgi:preprotein translocase subunit SecA